MTNGHAWFISIAINVAMTIGYGMCAGIAAGLFVLFLYHKDKS